MPNITSKSPTQFYDEQARFVSLTQSAQILRVAWYLFHYEKRDRFQPKDITGFFTGLNLDPPNIHPNIHKLCNQKRPKALLCDKRGYYLEGKLRLSMDDQLLKKDDGLKHVTSDILNEVSAKITDPVQREFLAETLHCYRVSAFRATIVMVWNLAYSHLKAYVLSDPDRLQRFNEAVVKRMPKCVEIKTDTDFEPMKEFDVVESVYTARLITKNTADILREKLKRRNAAAHPSSIKFVQSQADDMVADLILNVVAALK